MRRDIFADAYYEVLRREGHPEQETQPGLRPNQPYPKGPRKNFAMDLPAIGGTGVRNEIHENHWGARGSLTFESTIDR